MTLERLELRRVSLPLVRPFRTSFGTQTERDVLLIRATVDGVDGWGECVAGAVPDYSSEYTAGAQLVIEQFLGSRLLDADQVTAATVTSTLAGIDDSSAAAPFWVSHSKTALSTVAVSAGD